MRHLLGKCSIIVVLLALVFVSGPVLAQANPIGAAAEGKTETVTVTLAKKGPYKVFTLASPDRLVIDVPAMQGEVKPELPEDYEGTLVRSVRYGRFDPTTSRFVFELNGPARIQETKEEGKPFALVVSIAPTGKVTPKEKTEAQEPKETKPSKTLKEAKKAEEKPTPPKKAPKPVVVIDAGHGGVDPGAIGVGGVYEKDITLGYARALQQALLKTGKYKVMLTREGDQFILLRKRVAMAREAGGNLFISLHADSGADNQARGLSVYTLSETASDKEAAALAERENKADILANVDLSGESKDVADILISLAQRETKNQSAQFADMLVLNMSSVPTLPNPHRFAGFAVLKAPDIPSVLVELGFLSHPKEGKLLQDAKHRDKVIRALVKGVEAYFAKKKEMQ